MSEIKEIRDGASVYALIPTPEPKPEPVAEDATTLDEWRPIIEVPFPSDGMPIELRWPNGAVENLLPDKAGFRYLGARFQPTRPALLGLTGATWRYLMPEPEPVAGDAPELPALRPRSKEQRPEEGQEVALIYRSISSLNIYKALMQSGDRFLFQGGDTPNNWVDLSCDGWVPWREVEKAFFGGAQ